MTFFTQIRKIKKFLVASAFVVALTTLLASPNFVLASTYGSDNYDTCGYGTSCPAKKKTGSTTPAETTIPTNGNILLNDFSEYFSDGGIQLTLNSGQVINFDITSNGEIQHKSITIIAITDDYVDFSISMNSANLNVRFYINDTKKYDVNNDGSDDIQITLNGITDGKATMSFKAILGTSVKSPSTAKKASVLPATKDSSWWIWIIVSLVLILIAIIMFFILFKRRRKDENQKFIDPTIPPTTPNQPHSDQFRSPTQKPPDSPKESGRPQQWQ